MSKYRILIVDDDPGTQEILAQLLTPDYEVLPAENGVDALVKLERVQPDLVLADVMMPVMNGWDFVERLRQITQYAYTPVIFLTALWQKKHRDYAYEKGADLYLTKPVEPERLLRLIRQQLDESGKQPGTKNFLLEELQEIDLTHRAKSPRATPALTSSTVSGDLETAGQKRHQKIEGPAAKLKARVMVVDDSEDTQNLIRMVLEDNFEVLTAPDGLEAMDKALKYKPDLFIIDWMMPKFSGYQMVDVLRRTHEFQDSPIIFISARGSSRDKKLLERLEITEFIPKPFTPDRLRSAVEREIANPQFKIRPDKPDLNYTL